ncbi:hypothetical protein ACWGN5_10185, partial [Streptomyces sp. NPDC055815]
AVAGLPGWPLPVATVAPGVPAPHDPEPEEGDPAPLAPPSGEEWGPAQRRLGADEVAAQWEAWRARVGDESGEPAAPRVPEPAEAAGPPSAGAGDQGQGRNEGQTQTQPQPEPPSQTPAPGVAATGGAVPGPYTGVRKALDELRGYLEEPPPVGRVRASAGMLRADGPGWSLVAKADDMAFVLLDEAPREVLPVTRGPKLPALLEALDAMAVRAS